MKRKERMVETESTVYTVYIHAVVLVAAAAAV